MMQDVFLALGLVATVVTVAVVAGGMRRAMSREAGIIGSAFGLALWTIWTLNAFTVETVTAQGEVLTHSYRSLAFLGVAAAATLLFTLYKAGLGSLLAEEFS